MMEITDPVKTDGCEYIVVNPSLTPYVSTTLNNKVGGIGLCCQLPLTTQPVSVTSYNPAHSILP